MPGIKQIDVTNKKEFHKNKKCKKIIILMQRDEAIITNYTEVRGLY